MAGASQLTRAGYSVDEEFTLFAVRGIELGGLPHLPSALLYDRGLAYSYASWMAGWLTGSQLPAYRALSLLSALVSVLLVFAIVGRHATDRAAVLAATLVSMSLPFWATATTGRFYAPFLASYLAVLWLLSTRGQRTLGTLGTLGTIAFVSRLTHELAFTLPAIPLVCALLGVRAKRRAWLAAAAAIVTGLVAAQGLLFLLHALEPSSGETMVRRFFLWQVLNLFEVPPSGQYGHTLAAMVVAWLLVPARAGLATVAGLSFAAMVLSFSIARASNLGPLDVATVARVASDGAVYPLDMFRHLAAAHPVLTMLALASLGARLLGAGGEWRLHERGAHLLWLFWVLWFGVIDSGITTNYLLLPVVLMLAAIAIDVDAIVGRLLPRRVAFAVVALVALALGLDQWRGSGSIDDRLEAARPTIDIPGMDEVRAGLLPADRVACTDELACLMLVGRIDRWLALDDFVRDRFLVTRPDGTSAGVYTGAPAVFRPGDLFTPNADGTLPDRVLIVDVFKDFPVGHSAPWLPRAIELDGLQVIPMLETPQGRVLQISPQERYARRRDVGLE
ncbi:MAG: hypothetical protein Q8T13_09870 [Acidobacteriota bacterium]|nr:hypothetical protein [Acidobacteriota bacterium]